MLIRHISDAKLKTIVTYYIKIIYRGQWEGETSHD